MTESFAGGPVGADTSSLEALIDQSLESWLRQLEVARVAVERRVTPGTRTA
jgi:hypothetical protein